MWVSSAVVVLGDRAGSSTLGLGMRLRRGFVPKNNAGCVVYGTHLEMQILLITGPPQGHRMARKDIILPVHPSHKTSVGAS